MSARWIVLLVMALLLGLTPSVSLSQGGGQETSGTAAETGSASLEQLKKLRATLDDPDQRQALLEQIDALIAVRQSETGPDAGQPDTRPGLLAQVSRRIDTVSGQIAGLAGDVARLPVLASAAWERVNEPGQLLRWLQEGARLAALMALALAAGWITGRLTRPARDAVVATAANSWLFSVLSYLLHFLLLLLPTVAFVGIAYAALPLTGMTETTRTLTLVLVNAIAVVNAISLTGRELFLPPQGLPAVFRLTEESGAYVTVWIRRFAVIGVYGFLITDALGAFGLSEASSGVIERLLGLLLAGMAVVFVMQNRSAVAESVGKDADSKSLRSKLARTWHYLALLIIVLVTVVGLLGTAGSFTEIASGLLISVLVLVSAVLIGHGVEALLQRIFALSWKWKTLYPRLESRANRYLPVLRKVLKGIVYVLALLALLQVWGLGGMEWLSSETGRSLGGRLLSVGLTLLGALIVWEITTAILEDALSRESPGLDAAAVQRRQTLLPLAKNALRLTLIVLVALVVFSELGINIAPLLAGAGVIGLAIGFGAQTLVQDLITGVFILLEDSVAVGDFVEVAGYAGIVESLSIRSIRLRDIEGNVHTVPFSQVATVHNMTDDFAYALVDVGVAYRENVDDVITVLQEVGERLEADETWGNDILEGIEIWGLNALSDSSVDIRVRFKVVAGRQWAVRREYLRRVKAAFDERDIEIPFPHQTLYFGVDKGGTAPPARVRLDDGTPAPDTAPEGDDASVTQRERRKGELGGAQESN